MRDDDLLFLFQGGQKPFKNITTETNRYCSG